jgi:hypothetical protein
MNSTEEAVYAVCKANGCDCDVVVKCPLAEAGKVTGASVYHDDWCALLRKMEDRT